jgi:hypothetical protein
MVAHEGFATPPIDGLQIRQVYPRIFPEISAIGFHIPIHSSVT